MFFKYMTDERPEAPPPRPVYARVDQFEPLDDADRAPSMVLLDCVDAKWLDEVGERVTHLSDQELDEADWRISVVAVPSNYLDGVDEDADDSPEWFHLELGEPDRGPMAEQFHNLFQDPTERGVIKARPVTPSENAMLKRLAGWHDIEATDPTAIEEVLTEIGPVDAVAVYDVGQGAATALLSDGLPNLYFDLGGSAIANWRSFPEPLLRFCTSADPPVVLSHWDWDHWSSAQRDDRLLHQRWILPIQNQAGDLGAVHARFLAMLKTKSQRIYWWGYATPPITSQPAGVTVFRARGTQKSRNESGLALSVARNRRTVLLPADASLPNVWSGASSVDYLIVPHHGGRTALSTIPTPNNRSRDHLVYSYGVGNVYQHPLPRTVRAFRKSWTRNAHTALRDSSGLGHVGIDLTGQSQSLPQPLCMAGGCQLGIRQWI